MISCVLTHNTLHDKSAVGSALPCQCLPHPKYRGQAPTSWEMHHCNKQAMLAPHTALRTMISCSCEWGGRGGGGPRDRGETPNTSRGGETKKTTNCGRVCLPDFSKNSTPCHKPSHPCLPSHALLFAPGSMPVETCTPCGPREVGELSGSQWGPLDARWVGGTAGEAIKRRCHFGQARATRALE